MQAHLGKGLRDSFTASRMIEALVLLTHAQHLPKKLHKLVADQSVARRARKSTQLKTLLVPQPPAPFPCPGLCSHSSAGAFCSYIHT